MFKFHYGKWFITWHLWTNIPSNEFFAVVLEAYYAEYHRPNVYITFMAFLTILWCSHIGDHTQEEFAKFGYMSERNMVTLAQKPFVCILVDFFLGLPSGKNLPPRKCWLHSNFLTLCPYSMKNNKTLSPQMHHNISQLYIFLHWNFMLIERTGPPHSSHCLVCNWQHPLLMPR